MSSVRQNMISEWNNWFKAIPIRYGLALVAVSAGLLLRMGLTAWIGEGLPLFITFYPAVIATALLAGFGPGLLATLAAALAANYFVINQTAHLGMRDLQDWVAFGLFGCMGVFISTLAALYHRSRRQVASFEQTIALREASTQRGLALAAAGLGAWDYRFDSGEVFWDERCRMIWGMPEGQRIEYAKAVQRIHPDDFADIDSAVQQAVAGLNGGAFSREYRIIHPNGQIRWVASHGRALFEGEGERRHAVRFIGITADITERKAVEEELRQHRINLEARLDEQTKQIRRANQSLEQSIAERTAELEAANASLRQSRQAAVNLMEDALAARRQAEQVSEDLRREIAERQQAQEDLRANQDRLLLAQRAGRIGVFDVDLAAHTCQWTDEQKAIFGLPPTFHPTPDRWTALIHPEDRPGVIAARAQAFRKRHRELEQKYRIIWPDRQVRWVEDRGSITYNENGQALRFLGTSMDITAQRQALEQMRLDKKRFRHSAIRLVITLALSMFSMELAIMVTFSLLPPIAPWLEALVDASAMVILIGPILYFLTFRPLVRLLQERQAAEEALRQANQDLDQRVQDRTASLEQATAELQQSQRDLNRAQEVAHIGSWRLDVRSNTLYWSDENHRIFGIPKGTPLTYETFLDTVLPEDREFVHRQWTAALQGAPYDIEHRIQVAGSVKWVRERVELEFDEHGNLLGGLGTTQDITTLKQAELARRESEERLRQALQVGRVFTFEWEPQTDQVQRSPHCAEILGLTPAAAVRDSGMHYFEGVLPQDRQQFDAALDQLCPKSDTYHIKYRYKRPDNAVVTLEETARGFFNAHGQLERLVGITADITAREQIQQDIEWELTVNRALTALSHHVLNPQATLEQVAEFVLAQAIELTGCRDGVVSFVNGTTGEAICHARLTVVRAGQAVMESRRYTCPPGADDALPARLGCLDKVALDLPDDESQTTWKIEGKLPTVQIVRDQLLTTPVRLGSEGVGHILLANPPQSFARREVASINRLAENYALAIQLLRFKQQLEAERDFVQAILATAGALVVVLDTQGRIVRFNRTCEQLTGYTFDDVALQPFWDIFLEPEELSGVKLAFHQMLSGQYPNHHENFWRCKDGSLRRITWSNTVLLDDQAAVQYVIATGLDVTQIRATEDKLRVLSRAIEAGPASVVITNYEGTILYVNPTFAELTGYAPEEVIGQNPRLWKSGHHQAQYYADLWRTLTQGHEWHGEFCNKKKNGDLFWIYATIAPIRNDAGAISHIVAVTVDITERKRMEEALVRARNELEHKVTERTADLNLTIQSLHQEIEARRRAELEIQTLLQFERLVTDISADFANLVPGKFEQVSREGVRRLMKFFGADRAALAEFVGTDINLTVRCEAEGIPAAVGRLSVNDVPWSVACLRQHQRVAFTSLDELAGQAPVDRLSFLQHGTKSLLAVPLRVGQEILGALIFSNILKERSWPFDYVQRLKLVEDLFASLLMHWRSEQALSEAKTRYHTLANFIQDWDYWESPEGILLFCSPACERITGHSPQRFLVRPTLIHELVLPEDAGLWEEHRCGRREAAGPRNLEFRIRRADGEIRWIEHYCQSVKDTDGKYMGIRASNRDITDAKMREMETQRLREDLAHISRVTMANQLAASLAHELRQPLSAVMSNAEAAMQFLALQPPQCDEVKSALQDIIYNDERASEVIKRLRALYRKTGAEHIEINPNQVIEETLGLLRSELILRHISCQLKLAPDLGNISGNRVELQQVIMNLVLNAMDAMSHIDLEARRLVIESQRDETGDLLVSVRDAGPGIDPSVIGRLFEPFVTTKAAGMGMGLSVSHTIIEAHGGRMWAANNPDQGAIFHFTLPKKPVFQKP